jgi:ABC-type multidrug transport system ATPase subunit
LIQTKELTKYYGTNCAVDHLDWSVPAGSICGLLGPNGAGKSTTFKMLLGMTRPSSGTGFLDNFHIVQESLRIRKVTTFLPEDKIWYSNLTCGEFLKLYSSFFPAWSVERAERFLKNLRIPIEKKQTALPKGMRTKVLLIAAMASNTEVMLLDEPTEGLDPQGSEEILSMLTDFVAERERTLVLATHRLDEVERICDRIAILHEGKLRLSGNLDDIKGAFKTIELMEQIPVEEIRSWNEVFTVRKNRIGYSIVTRQEPSNILQRLRQFSSNEPQISDMNLREIYLAITGSNGETSDATAQTLV